MEKNPVGPMPPKGLRGDNSSGTATTSSSPAHSRVIGPALPPGFKPQNTSDTEAEGHDNMDSIGPALPPGLRVINRTSSDEDSPIGPSGPALPLRLRGNKQVASDEDSPIGPVLPPKPSNSRKSPDSKSDTDSDSDSGVMGPALPPGFKINNSSAPVKGPLLPPGSMFGNKSDNSDDEDDYIVGPLPTEMDRSGRSNVVEEFEQRASNMKDKLTNKEDAAPVREAWMTELPPEMGVDLGLSARKFRSKPTNRGEDRSCWTDTPADKARKQQEVGSGKGKSSKEKPVQQNVRDRRIAEQVDSYNKNKRKDTLLEMHQTERKKLKAEAPTDTGPPERRPFDREVDLKVNRFDDAMRKSVIKKSQQLNTRFSHGSNSQFL